MENIDPRHPPGQAIQTRILGMFEEEAEAVEAGRAAMAAFKQGGQEDYAWWLVREEGSQLSRWIADSLSEREYVLDLRSGQLVELP